MLARHGRARDQTSHFPPVNMSRVKSSLAKIGCVGDDGHFSVVRSKSKPVFWKVFSGKGQLSKMFKKYGFEVRPH